MKKLTLFIATLVLLTSFTACSNGTNKAATTTPTPAPQTITVSAAASLKTALDEIKPEFEKENNINLSINYGSSGTLQKQIEQGASVDVFISAGKKQVDALDGENLIIKDSRVNLLTNKLVLVVAKEYTDKVKSIDDVVNVKGQLSIGQVDTVPAGQYAKDTLTSLKLWDKLQNKIVYAKDVTQVLSYVESGNAVAGIVYNSDATGVKNSTVVQIFDESLHKPIVYPAAIISATKYKDASQKFIDYLKTDKAQSVFVKYGFNGGTK